MIFLAVPVAQAAVTIDPKLHPDNAPTITGYKNEPELNIEEARVVLTGRIVGIILGVAGTVAVYFIINSGWWLAASAGKEETVTQHKKGLQWAVIGLVLIILSYSILRFIISITFKADERVNSPTPAPEAGTADFSGVDADDALLDEELNFEKPSNDGQLRQPELTRPQSEQPNLPPKKLDFGNLDGLSDSSDSTGGDTSGDEGLSISPGFDT